MEKGSGQSTLRRVHILPERFSKLEIEQLQKHAAAIDANLVAVEHADVVVTRFRTANRIVRHLAFRETDPPMVVSQEWLVDSGLAGHSLDPRGYAIEIPAPILAAEFAARSSQLERPETPTKRKRSNSPGTSSLESLESTHPTKSSWRPIPEDASPLLDPRYLNSKYACDQPHPQRHHNEALVAQLRILEEWRRLEGRPHSELSYARAAAALTAYPRPVTSAAEAGAIRAIGAKTATLIGEFLRTGRIAQVDTALANKEFAARRALAAVFGVGPHVARQWRQLGIKTVDDARARADSLNLSVQQRLGLELHRDLQQKLSRKDVEQLVALVTEAARAVDPACETIPVGGYRRGKPASGDADVLVIPSGSCVLSHDEMLDRILDRFRGTSILVSVLSRYRRGDEGPNEAGDSLAKAICAVRQPSTGIVRQVDVILAAESHRACALVSWTGSKMFERSLRLYLSRQCGLHFASHGLFNRRTGVEISVSSERHFFELAGLQYLEPSDRNA